MRVARILASMAWQGVLYMRELSFGLRLVFSFIILVY